MIKNRLRLFWNIITRIHPVVVYDTRTMDKKRTTNITYIGLAFALSIFAILIAFLVSLLFYFTAIKQYLPGFLTDDIEEQLVQFNNRIDSIQQSISITDQYVENFQTIISSPRYLTAEEIQRISSDAFYLDSSDPDDVVKSINQMVFFYPVKNGKVSKSYSLIEKHFAMDIVGPTESPIYAIYDGVVIFSGFTIKNGYVLIIQHENDLISIYKHNKEVFPKTGEKLKGGTLIAIMGNSGENTTGAHLHLEMIHKGQALDPIQFLPSYKQ